MDEYAAAVTEILTIFDDDPQMTDIQRAIGYARTLKVRVPDGPGFEA